jgi:Uma2 family endonuclease
VVAYAKAPKVTPTEYLELEKSAETKSEYHNGVIIAMAGGTFEHDLANLNILATLHVQLRGKPCVPLTGNMRVNVPGCNCYYYPDTSVACEQPEFQRIEGVQSLTNPILIVEVLSDSTERFDRERKFFCYQTLPSLRTYVLVAQDEPLVQVFEKQVNGKWEFSHYQGLDAVAPLPSIDCELNLVDVYERIEFKLESETTTLQIMEERARYSSQNGQDTAPSASCRLSSPNIEVGQGRIRS